MMSRKETKDLTPLPDLTDLPPLGMDVHSMVEDFRRYYTYTLGRDRHCRSAHYAYSALVLGLRDRLMERWKATRYAYEAADARQTYYLSLEFLMGRTLGNALLNLGLSGDAPLALQCLGLELEEIAEAEHDAGLGNGGLGRLAACFLDSCATLKLPVTGYGIRYEYGMFRQKIVDGHQVEEPDHWLWEGNPWELERPEYTQRVHFGGRTEFFNDHAGAERARWVETRDVFAVPFDIPIPGYDNGTVNTLRLWKAAATDEFNLGEFNAGLYPESVAAKNAAENITMVLYPNDASESGKELRLRQQYFLASASLKDVLARWVGTNGNDFSRFAEKNVFQLNDTHPSCCVPELMRLLMDEHGLGWDEAWGITTRTMAYTNHTLLPEALEKWPVRLFHTLLPRLLEIIYEINARFLGEVARHWPGDSEKQRRMSVIEEGGEPMVRMAYLAIVGSFSVNGVAALHSRLLTEGLFRDFYELWPNKFNNKTNGVTPRRWLADCNPGLTALITEKIGGGWVDDLARLSRLAPLVDDADFRQRWHAVKRENKERLSRMVQAECGVDFNPDALFDVQVKRIHEYKRQLLNLLHTVALYQAMRDEPTTAWVPRVKILAGKAAASYQQAKLIIKLANDIARTINDDPTLRGQLKVVFLPNYNVSLAEQIIPAADLSEQISTAGMEASGTSNMKFALNGALTIGTLDGANVEMLERIGDEHMFIFGLNARQVEMRRQEGPVAGEVAISASPRLHEVLQAIRSGVFSPDDPARYTGLVDSLIWNDHFMVCADFDAYWQAQAEVEERWRDPRQWWRSALMNCAGTGWFSSDRTIREYAREIWRVLE